MITRKFNKRQPMRTEFASGAEARAHFVLQGYKTQMFDQTELTLIKQGHDRFIDVIVVSKVDDTRWIVGGS
jgi:threonyl-tRNA synthetase